MTHIPSGWYDDPEDPSQHRYWNGEAWTDNKAPKVPQATARPEATGIVSEGIQLVKETWAGLLGIAVIMSVITYVAMIFSVILLIGTLLPGAEGDKPFGPPWQLIFFIAPVVACPPILLVCLGSATIHLAAAQAGQAKTIRESFGLAWGRFPRWIARSLLWLLISAVAMTVLVVLAEVVSPILLWLYLPLVVFIWPYFHIATVAFFVTPRDVPPLRSVISLLDGRWRFIARQSLLPNLVLFGVMLLSGIPLIGLVALLGLYMLSTAFNVSLYACAGGPVANDIVTDNSLTKDNTTMTAINPPSPPSEVR